jgi:hypothetical protein
LLDIKIPSTTNFYETPPLRAITYGIYARYVHSNSGRAGEGQSLMVAEQEASPRKGEVGEPPAGESKWTLKETVEKLPENLEVPFYGPTGINVKSKVNAVVYEDWPKVPEYSPPPACENAGTARRRRWQSCG